jgi:DNA-binding transcriptional LysR family regulator
LARSRKVAKSGKRPTYQKSSETVKYVLIANMSHRRLAYLMDDVVQADVTKGRLIRVLADWCAPFSGYHLYYPSRQQPSPAFALLVNALRFKDEPRNRVTRR